jgi:hypothetical protein
MASRWTNCSTGHHKRFSSQHHVLLLLLDSVQTRDEEISLVEKAHNANSTLTVYHFNSSFFAKHHRSRPQLSTSISVVFSGTKSFDVRFVL